MLNNYSLIAIYMPLIVGTVLILISIVGGDMSKQVLREYLFFSISLLCWQITEGLFYVFSEQMILEKVFNIKMVFMCLSAVFILRLIVKFYKLDRKLPQWIFNVIFIIPAITAILALSKFGRWCICPGFEVISNYPLNEAVYQMGIWSSINAVFSNLLVICAGIIVILMQYRLPKAYRSPLIAFIIALLFYVAGYAIEIIFELGIGSVIIGVSFSNLAIYFVVIDSGRGEYLSVARREIFNYLDDVIFILDEKKRIVDANKRALQWLDMLGKNLTFASFPKMLTEFENEGLLEQVFSEDKDSVEIKMTHTDILLVYEMNEIYMYADNGKLKGEFVTLEDVTRTSLFIDRLEIDAGMDPLTGLQNRYTFEELIDELDKPDHYPISVIVGDVNSLKHINDTYGHIAGDTLLSAAGQAVGESCPPNGYACRVGGDEFVILIPHCDENGAMNVINDIKAKLKTIKNLHFEVEMALGSVTKKAEGEALRNLITEADKNMYTDKTRSKGESI